MTAEVVLAVDELCVTYGGITAVDRVSLSVPAGQVVGLIGPNGAGKTTLIDAVTGYTPAVSGTVRLDDVDLTGLAAHQRARAGLGRTFQSLELFDDLTVAENVAVGVGGRPGRASVRARLGSLATDLSGPSRSAAGRRRAVAEVVDLLGLGSVADRRPSTLSGGQRHLVALGRALAGQPRVVLLDEPAAGLDPTETAQLGAVLAGLPAVGVAVLLVDHDMDLVMGTCDTVHVVDFGRRIASGPPAQVRTDPVVLDAYLGTSTSGRSGSMSSGSTRGGS